LCNTSLNPFLAPVVFPQQARRGAFRRGMRTLNIIGDIDAESYANFVTELRELEAESNDDIEIELNSEGGIALDAIAFSSRMRVSPCKFTIKAYGLVGSAAVLILASGDKRIMTRESWLYVHEDQNPKVRESTSEKEKAAKQMRRFENQWNQLLEFYTKTSAELWADLHRKDLFISAEECVTLGIVDEVV
jgi:ATP-dependent protease ClpP protease subunit